MLVISRAIQKKSNDIRIKKIKEKTHTRNDYHNRR